MREKPALHMQMLSVDEKKPLAGQEFEHMRLTPLPKPVNPAWQVHEEDPGEETELVGQLMHASAPK